MLSKRKKNYSHLIPLAVKMFENLEQPPSWAHCLLLLADNWIVTGPERLAWWSISVRLPNYVTPGKPAKLECFLPDLIDFTTNLFLVGALVLIPWLLRRAVVGERNFFSCSQSEGKEIKFVPIHLAFSNKRNLISKSTFTVHGVQCYYRDSDMRQGSPNRAMGIYNHTAHLCWH